MNKAVFLDKDGVINEDFGFVHKIEDFQLVPGTLEAMKRLSDSDYKIIVVSNASAVGRGMCTEEQFMKFHDDYTAYFAEQGVKIDDANYCFHHPTAGIGEYKADCECRKPKSGMLNDGIEKCDVDASASFIVGDKRSDIVAGRNVGCKTFLVATGCGGKGGDGCDVEPDYEVANLAEAVDIILGAG